MKIQIIGADLKINKRIKKLIQEKIAIGLEKHLQNFGKDIKTATVKIYKRTRWGYRVNFDMRLPGKENIFAKASHRYLPSAIIQLREKIERQIKKYKTQLKS